MKNLFLNNYLVFFMPHFFIFYLPHTLLCILFFPPISIAYLIKHVKLSPVTLHTHFKLYVGTECV